MPVEYEGNEKGTALLMWKEGEDYVPKLAKYLSWPIAEGFLVFRKPDGTYDGFLAQIAFDPLKSRVGQSVDPDHFTGLVINADWNENILRSWRFLDGKLVSYFNPDVKKKSGRTQQCITTYSQYSTVTGVSCGPSCIDVTYTLHTVANTRCYDDYNGSDQGGYTGSGGYSPSNTGGYTPSYPPGYSPYFNYNKYNLLNVPNSLDRTEFNNRILSGLNVTGLTTSITGLNLDTATSLIKTLGMEFSQIKLVGNFSTRCLGGIGVVSSFFSFAIGWVNDGWQWDEEGVNLLLLGIGAVGVAAGGWIAVGAGALTVIIAVAATAYSD